MKTFLLILLLGAAQLLANPIAGSFSQIQTQGGGWQTGFAQHPSGRLYCRTDVGGVYRSDDFGESWQFLSGDFTTVAPFFVHGLAVSPQDPDQVFIACGTSYASSDPNRGIWKSSDGGTSWTHVANTINFSGNDTERHGGEALIFHPGDSTELFAATRGSGLYHSTNSGDSWSKIGGATLDGINLAGVYIHPSFPQQVFAYGSGGCWLSLDRGDSFTLLYSSDLAYRVVRKNDGTLFCSDNTTVWRYTATDWTDPNTWTRTNIYSSDNSISAIQILANGNLFLAPFFRNLEVSTDDGDTFSSLPKTLTGTIPNWHIAPGQQVPSDELGGGYTQLLQDATNPNRLFLTGGYGISRSNNNGQSWEFIPNNINEVVCWKVQFHPSNPQKILLPMADHALAVLPDQSNSLIATNYNARHFAWPDDILNFAHTAFYSGSRIIAPGAEAFGQTVRLYLSNNDGQDWSKINFTGLPTNSFNPIVSGLAADDDPDELLLLLGGSWGSNIGGVYRSTDAGSTFTQSILPSEALSYNDGSPYWGGDEFVWTNDLHADGGSSNTRYLIQRYFRLLRSNDRGQTWTTLSPSGLTGTATYFDGTLATDPQEQGRVWLAASDGLWTSTDSGESFAAIGSFSSLNPDVRIDARGGRIVVRGRLPGDSFDKIYYSPDNGEHWGEITRSQYRLPDTQALALDPWRPGTVWISTGGQSVLKFTPASPTINTIAKDSNSITITTPSSATPPRLTSSPDLATPFSQVIEATIDPNNTFTFPSATYGPRHFFKLEP